MAWGTLVKIFYHAVQLNRLLDILKEITGPTTNNAETICHYAWVNSLCCPATNIPSKIRALEKMAETYRKANSVLVLDASREDSHLEPFWPRRHGQNLYIRLDVSIMDSSRGYSGAKSSGQI